MTKRFKEINERKEIESAAKKHQILDSVLKPKNQAFRGKSVQEVLRGENMEELINKLEVPSKELFAY